LRRIVSNALKSVAGLGRSPTAVPQATGLPSRRAPICPSGRTGTFFPGRAPLATAQAAQDRVREKTKYTRRFNADSGVQISREKYISSVFQNDVVRFASSRLDEEGRIAIVTTREAGMRWTR